jgi:hypothetical protein
VVGDVLEGMVGDKIDRIDRMCVACQDEGMASNVGVDIMWS